MLATVQQVSFGIGPRALGVIFSYVLSENSGTYRHTAHAALLTEQALGRDWESQAEASSASQRLPDGTIRLFSSRWRIVAAIPT